MIRKGIQFLFRTLLKIVLAMTLKVVIRIIVKITFQALLKEIENDILGYLPTDQFREVFKSKHQQLLKFVTN